MHKHFSKCCNEESILKYSTIHLYTVALEIHSKLHTEWHNNRNGPFCDTTWCPLRIY